MLARPSLPNPESYNTKDMIKRLANSFLLANNPDQENRGEIPNKYIVMYVLKDCPYAKAIQKAKHPDALLIALSKASSLEKNITKTPKTEKEYGTYLTQLRNEIKNADNQLAKQKELATNLDRHLSTWSEMHQANSAQLIRPGVTTDSPIMTTNINNAFEKINELLEEYKATMTANEVATKSLVTAIASTEAVVPQEMVREASMQAASLNSDATTYDDKQKLTQK